MPDLKDFWCPTKVNQPQIYEEGKSKKGLLFGLSGKLDGGNFCAHINWLLVNLQFPCEVTYVGASQESG